MEIKTVTKFREDGSVRFKENVAVFSVEDKGNGIARGQISCSRLPYDKSKSDQALLNAGYKLDQKGYIRGSIFVSFRGNAYQKALNLKNGALIEDVVFDIDPFPYVGKDGKVEYRQNPQWVIIDFNEKQFGNAGANNGEEQPFTKKEEKPYPQSPMYTQQPKNEVVEDEEDEDAPEY